jgi:hypothetical protein
VMFDPPFAFWSLRGPKDLPDFIKCYLGHHIDASTKVIVGVLNDMWANADGDCWVAWVSLLGDERRVYEVAMSFLGSAFSFNYGDKVNWFELDFGLSRSLLRIWHRNSSRQLSYLFL